jgi:sterol desaturase/sphingolipid hydroxylase (fatty acid hydroxylase superfamily)
MWDFAVNTADRFVASTPAKLWFGAFCVGFVLERLLKNAESGQKLRGYGRNVAHSIVYLVVFFLLAPSVYIPIAAISNRLGGGLINAQIVDNTTWLNQIIVFALLYFIVDFFQYWWHRMQHRVPFLWDQHVVHHSEDAMNVTTATRHHWSEFMFQSLVVSLPFGLLFKLTPATVGIVAMVFGSWQFFVHLNVRISLGQMARLVGGPQFHRIHHSRLSEHIDRNFSAYFPVWDIIFGTYHHPKRGEYPPTGVSGTRIESVWALSVHPFVQWGRRIALRMRPARFSD